MEVIKRRNDFKRVYAKGHRQFGPNLVICFLPNRLKKIRFGVSASKKVGCAVQRNRARRIMKEACKDLDTKFGFYDIVIVAKPSILALKMQAVREEVLSLMVKAVGFNKIVRRFKH